MQCETCRRPLGTEQLKCPRRSLGSENLCAYQVEETRLDSSGWAGWLVLGLVLGLIALLPVFMREILPWLVLVGFFPVFLLGVYLMGMGLYLLLGRKKAIFNPATGQAWEQTSILGLPVTTKIISPLEKIAWQGAAARQLRYPASVAELCRKGRSAELIKVALLQLLAQGVIVLGRVTVWRKIGKPGQVYVLLLGDIARTDEVLGELEKRLVAVVGLANPQEASLNYMGKSYPRTLRSGLGLEDVIRIVFEGGQKSPYHFLLREVVGKQAVELGLGELLGEPLVRFVPGKNGLGKIALDMRSVEQLERDFWTSQPADALELLAQIDLVVYSMSSANHERKG